VTRPHADAPLPAILLVDDTPANLLALTAVLEPLPARLVKAASGEEALKHLLHEDFACVLLDVQMPGIDGFETARLMKGRKRSHHVPLLFLTALSREEAHVLRGYAEGAVDYVLKPFNPDVLLAKVRVFLELHAREQRMRAQEAALHERERRVLEAERQRAEQAQAAAEDRLRLALDAAQVGTWRVDLRARTVARDTGLNRIFGLGTAETVVPLAGALGHVHPEDRARVKAVGVRFARGEGADGLEEVYRVVRPDGEVRWVRDRGRLVLGEDGAPAAVTGAAVDVTELQRAQEERERIMGELDAAVRLRDEFLSVASHELKTPLTSLRLQLDLIGRTLREEGAGRCTDRLGSARRQVDRLATLVGELLDVSRIREGQLELELSEVPLAALVREVAERFEAQAAVSGCRLEVEAPDGPPGRWDAGRLEQVVTNLLSNALKYGAGKPVRLRVEHAEGLARLTVRDEGIGIAPEALGRIFGRFERGVSERHYGGLGLGLYITRTLVEAMGGSVRAESRLGEGATFTVELPAGPGVH
jgi:PAS domain S-box-containing protein